MGFEKALGAVKVITDQVRYRSQSLFNLARDYFKHNEISLGQKNWFVLGDNRQRLNILNRETIVFEILLSRIHEELKQFAILGIFLVNVGDKIY